MFINSLKYLIAIICAEMIYSYHAYSQQFTESIEDNSFFIEEAYNQQERVVQHISSGYYQTESREFVYTFTQEWPVGSQTHQLSYTIPYQSMVGGSKGFGDIYINYRYQLWDDRNWGWVAPRLSLILPSGNSSKGLGNGVVGMQACLPVSKRWSNEFISHFNLGITILPNIKGITAAGSSIHKTLPSYYAGISGIWLLAGNFNLMCEALYTINSGIDGDGNMTYSSQGILSPGIRYAINLGNLQIVPGVAFPFSITSTGSDINLFGYLSFEHPF